MGGLYVDVDQECIAPHDIFHHISDLYLGILDEPQFFLGNGVIGAKDGNLFLKKCIEEIYKNTHAIINSIKLDVAFVMN